MNRKLHATLALIAVVSFGLYILGCVGYAAWNADGSKLLIPYYSPQAEEWGVTLYDLKTHATKKLMIRTGVKREELSMQVQWVKGASQPFILVTSDKRDSDDVRHVDAYMVPLAASAPIRNWVLPNAADVYATGPFPELNNEIIVPSNYLAAISLQDGTVRAVKYDDGEEKVLSVASDGKRIFYVRGATRPASKPDNPDASEDGAQFGELSVPDLKRIRYFELWSSELEAQGVQLQSPQVVAEQGGTRLALVGKHADAPAILVINSARLERSVAPKFSANGCRLGSFVWPRAEMMYAVVGCPTTVEHIAQISIAEIAVSDGAVRMVPILRVNADSDFWENFEPLLKPSIAPNGRLLALTATVLDDEQVTPDDRALFLVDLKAPDRHVTKIAIPGVTKVAVH